LLQARQVRHHCGPYTLARNDAPYMSPPHLGSPARGGMEPAGSREVNHASFPRTGVSSGA
jgi:hypothetical protein